MPTFNELINKSSSDVVVLFELDLLKINVQWINYGAGIWQVNINNLYSFVDSSLLDGFTIQDFYPIGSVLLDQTYLTQVSTLLLVTSANESYYYDIASGTLYIHTPNNDEPWLHTIWVGVINGYSFDDFTPSGLSIAYQGRLRSAPSWSKTRDPLFFGKLNYPQINIDLINADGYFDTFGEDNTIYGNPGRIKIGFKDIAYTDYVDLFNGYIGPSTITEEGISFTVSDPRKQLTKKVNYSCTNKNALDAIVELLLNAYGYTYTSAYYNTTIWDAATLLAPNITIDYSDINSQQEVNSIIEEICTSLFGIFDTDKNGLFIFTYINPISSAITIIQKYDQINAISIEYDPSEVVSSVKIGYAKDWTAANSGYTYLIDTDRELDIFKSYKTYNEQTFDTLLINLSDAQTLADKILDYCENVHGTIQQQLPISYYDLNIADIVSAVIDRSINTMLGTKTCEVLDVGYDLTVPTVNVKLRII